MASTLLLLIRNQALALPDDSELIDELANLGLRENSPGVFRLDPDKHDDRAIALALAAHMLVGDTWGRPERPARTEWDSPRERIMAEWWEREVV